MKINFKQFWPINFKTYYFGRFADFVQQGHICVHRLRTFVIYLNIFKLSIISWTRNTIFSHECKKTNCYYDLLLYFGGQTVNKRYVENSLKIKEVFTHSPKKWHSWAWIFRFRNILLQTWYKNVTQNSIPCM